MLKTTSTKITECLAKAAYARDRARFAAHPDDRAFYTRMEGLWMRLAEAHAFTERIDSYLLSHSRPADGTVAD